MAAADACSLHRRHVLRFEQQGGALAAADGLMGRYNSGLNVTKRDVVRAERAWAAREATKGAGAATNFQKGLKDGSKVRDDDGFTMPASVPGDVVTDLQAAGAIGDPLLDDNFVRDAPVWNRTWTLRTSFRVDSDAARIVLVFDGVKMGATVILNHQTLGTLRDQFLRYVFDVRNASIDLLRETNKLELIFDPSIDVASSYD